LHEYHIRKLWIKGGTWAQKDAKCLKFIKARFFLPFCERGGIQSCKETENNRCVKRKSLSYNPQAGAESRGFRLNDVKIP